MKTMMCGLAVTLGLGLPAMAWPPADLTLPPWVTQPAIFTQPDWITLPNADDLSEHYPKAATLLAIDGYAAISCKVDGFGGLENCETLVESPTAEGFGPAALAMAPLFRMKPMTRDGKPVAGGQITIPIRFRMDPAPPEPSPPASVSPEILALARRFVRLMNAEATELATMDRTASEIEFIDDDGTPVETRAAAAEAIRAAAKADIADYVDGEAAALAAIYSQAELAGIVGFLESPGGALLRPDRDADALKEMLTRGLARQAVADAGAAFCRDHACAVDPAFSPTPRVVIPNPAWVRTPDENAIGRARPALLALLGLNGAAQLTCHVDALATPVDCKVAAEAPAGLGVGAAALPLASEFRLQPELMAQGAQGETVAVIVPFPGPVAGDPYEPPPPRSARGLALAREFIALQPPPPAGYEAWLESLPQTTPPGADPATWAAATRALRGAIGRATSAYLAHGASIMAALYTEDQLAAAIAFQHSAAGHALSTKMGAAQAAMQRSDEAAYPKLIADARTLFCKDHPCTVDPEAAAVSRSR